MSKSDVAPATTGTLNQICNQTPTDLVQCYAGTGSAGYDGAATGQGLAFIHSFADEQRHARARPLLRDVQLTSMVCTGGARPGNLSGPYYINDDSDCTVGVTAKVDFGVPTHARERRSRGRSRIRAASARESDLWTGQSTSGNISTWTGNHVGSRERRAAGADAQLAGQDLRHQLQQPQQRDLRQGRHVVRDGRQFRSCRLRQAHGDRGRTARPPAPPGATVADANSTPRGNYCYSVNVGLDQPLALKPWNSPSIVLRFGSKAARKGGSGTANLNGSLLCDSGRTLEDSFSSGCFTTYGLNFDKWGTSITPVCTPGVKCWKDVKCAAYPPSSLPPASYVNNPPPICVAAKNGQVQAFQAGMYNRFEDPANGSRGCSRNNWPTTAG